MAHLRTALPVLVAVGAIGALGCGHKGPPFPPALKNPAQTIDLIVQQRSQAAVLSFTYPQTTVAGEHLESLERIEVWRLKRLVYPPPVELLEEPAESGEVDPSEVLDAPETDEPSEEAESEEANETESDSLDDLPEVSLEVQTAADPLEFNATAELVDTVDAEAIEQAIDGTKIVVTVDLGEADHEEWSHTFGIKTFASEKLASAYSNLVTLVQRQPPPEPTEFQAAAEASGIKLSWSLPESDEEPPDGFRVYRRSSESRIYSDPLVLLPFALKEHLDTTAVFGERYIYAVTTIGHQFPLVESFFGGEREIDYADRFAPVPPTNLIALAEVGRVRLLWDASPEDDVVGYIVFRRQSGAEFRRLTDEPVVTVEYSDRTVEPGATYDYRVAAIDRIGNHGEQSDTVVARVP